MNTTTATKSSPSMLRSIALLLFSAASILVLPAAPGVAFDPLVGVPGTVISYLRPGSDRFVGSPTLVRLDDGALVATHDIFSRNPALADAPRTTLVFRSEDAGKTWKQHASLPGQYWSSLFTVNESLYIIGVDRRFGSIVIRRSLDGGMSWSTPQQGGEGYLTPTGYGTSPVPVVQKSAKVFCLVETLEPGDGPRRTRLGMMSARITDNLLDPRSWQISEPVPSPKRETTGQSSHPYLGLHEGNLVPSRQGLAVLYRYDSGADDRLAYLFEQIDPADAQLDHSYGWVEFALAKSKFSLFHDAPSEKYWAVGNRVTKGDYRQRTVLSLVSSKDLRSWEHEADLISHAGNWRKVAIQYPTALVDGDDLLLVCRTALNSAQDYHDANYLTFHRIKDFRSIRANSNWPIHLPVSAPVITSKGPLKFTLGKYQTERIWILHDADSMVITGLPRGLTYKQIPDRIDGVPEEVGEFVIKITATNALGSASSVDLSLIVTPPSGQ